MVTKRQGVPAKGQTVLEKRYEDDEKNSLIFWEVLTALLAVNFLFRQHASLL